MLIPSPSPTTNFSTTNALFVPFFLSFFLVLLVSTEFFPYQPVPSSRLSRTISISNHQLLGCGNRRPHRNRSMLHQLEINPLQLTTSYRMDTELIQIFVFFCFVFFITRLGFFPFCFQRHRWNVLDVLPGKK